MSRKDSQKAYEQRRKTQAAFVARKRFYDSAVWQKKREYIIASRVFCEDCRARGLLVPGIQVDHIVDIAASGAELDDANLRLLCASCHSFKTKSHRGPKGAGVNGLPIDPAHPWNRR